MAAPARSAALHSRWPVALVALAALLVAIVWLYRDAAIGMVTIWSRSETFAHAFLVPPLVGWLIWRRRAAVAALDPRPNFWMLLPMAIAGFAWLLGDLASTNAVSQLAFVTLLVLTVPLVLGGEVARLLLFPLAFSYFAVPLGEFMMPQLMTWTADFTVLALRASGIPVYREGLQFVIPSGNWSVVEACSGIRYLIASVMVGVLYAYINYRSLKRRLIFVGVAILVPVIANWVRAYLIVLIGHLSSNRLAVGVDHLIYGWVFFAIIIVAMYMIGARWAEAPADDGAAGSTHAPRAMPARFWPAAAAALVVLLAPVAAKRVTEDGDRHTPPLLTLPDRLAGDWTAAPAIAAWKPAFRGPAAEAERSYAEGGRGVGLYVGYYRQQADNSKLVSSDNVLVTLHDADWSPVGEAPYETALDGRKLVVRRAEVRAAGHAGAAARGADLVAWQVYWIDGDLIESDAEAKARIAWARLRGHGDDAAVLVIYARADVAGGADNALGAFLRANLHAITTQLSRTRDGS